jgi:hypothetical protein
MLPCDREPCWQRCHSECAGGALLQQERKQSFDTSCRLFACEIVSIGSLAPVDLMCRTKPVSCARVPNTYTTCIVVMGVQKFIQINSRSMRGCLRPARFKHRASEQAPNSTMHHLRHAT